MFGWLKRRQIKEQLKLLYQNNSAVSYLLGYFDEKQDVEVSGWLRQVEKQLQAVAGATAGGREAGKPEELQWLLETNRKLRKLYEGSFGARLASFDKSHSPAQGWHAYFAQAIELERNA